jgi:hypothetical protein
MSFSPATFYFFFLTEMSAYDSPDRFNADQVQEARIALLEHHTSQMQAYVDRGLMFFAALLGVFAVFVQFQRTLQNTVRLTIFVGLGFLCGCILFSIARFARYGMTLRAVAHAPLRIKAGDPSTLLGQLDTCIGEWAKQDIEDLAKRNWLWKLWKPFFQIGDSQAKSILAAALLWIIVVAILIV